MSQNVPRTSVRSSLIASAGRAVASAASVLPPVAVAVVALVGAAVLAALCGALVLFGAGLVVVVALLVLGVVLLVRRRRTTPWLLVPLLATAVPAVAVAVSGERVAAQRGVELHAPLTADEIPKGGYRTGLGEQLVDLRSLDLPAGRTITVKARSDLARTVVALPRKVCWNLDVRWRTGDAWLPGVKPKSRISGLDPAGRRDDGWLGRTRTDSYFRPVQGRIAIFGRVHRESRGHWTSRVSDPAAPTVRLDLRSLGSTFAVRDYPNDVGPLGNVTWPLRLTPPASPAERRAAWSRPGKSRRSAREWRAYRKDRAAFVRRAAALMDGGCGRRKEAR